MICVHPDAGGPPTVQWVVISADTVGMQTILCSPLRMGRTLRILAILLASLALLTWIAFLAINRTTRGWYERDVALRAELAIKGARHALISYWRTGDRQRMGDLLTEITHDERIMGAAACNADLTLLAGTTDYPGRFSCAELGGRLRPHPDAAAGTEWRPWRSTAAVAGGNVFVSANPINDGGVVLGFVALVHDLSFIELREAKAQRFIWGAFGILAAILSVVGMLTARYSWRSWTAEIRRLLRGGPHSPEFQPIWRDVRELVERLGAEAESDSKGGPWTAQRLKQTLHRHLHGEKIIIVANREPYIHDRTANGSIRVLHPASGLVTALEPVMRACSGVWVAHGAGSADRESADGNGRVKVPPGEESYMVRRVWLSAEEEQGYYYGFSNEGLWPLCHIAHHRPIFRTSDWKHYQAVNRRFAEAVCEEADSDDPIILVQDYHFALAPQMIRTLLPRATILTFWHIPWPNAERMAICPWHDELLEGLLGSSIVGFHTRQHCNNFLDAVDSFLEARIDREQTAVVQHRRTTLVRPYPISIEWPSRWMASSPPIDECHASVRGRARLAPRDPHRSRGRSARLHEGRGGAIPGRRAAPGAGAVPAWQVYVRSAGGAQPHRHRALSPPERNRRTRRGPHQRPLRGRALPPHRVSPRPPRTAGGLPLSARCVLVLCQQSP